MAAKQSAIRRWLRGKQAADHEMCVAALLNCAHLWEEKGRMADLAWVVREPEPEPKEEVTEATYRVFFRVSSGPEYVQMFPSARPTRKPRRTG